MIENNWEIAKKHIDKCVYRGDYNRAELEDLILYMKGGKHRLPTEEELKQLCDDKIITREPDCYWSEECYNKPDEDIGTLLLVLIKME